MKASVKLLAVAIPYLGFSVTDGAIRMMIILHFHARGFTPIEIAFLFLLYEIAGVITNFMGGWIGARVGLSLTLLTGFACQLVAMTLLTAPDSWLVVPYVMITQGLSGIAKDLVKVSSKSAIKIITPEGEDTSLFQSVSLLTGSKNSFKGLGYLIGGFFTAFVGLRLAMILMTVALGIGALLTAPALPKQLGLVRKKVKFRAMFSKSKAINVLSAARFFLFGSRDIWFVVGLPVYLEEVLRWRVEQIGIFLGMWIIGYGWAQTSVPKVLDGGQLARTMGAYSVAIWSALLMIFPMSIAAALILGAPPGLALISGLMLYGLFFAVNSIIHSYLVLAYSERSKASADVGFYYTANSGGRLVGSLTSGWVYQTQGLIGCLTWSVAFLAAAAVISLWLPPLPEDKPAEDESLVVGAAVSL